MSVCVRLDRYREHRTNNDLNMSSKKLSGKKNSPEKKILRKKKFYGKNSTEKKKFLRVQHFLVLL